MRGRPEGSMIEGVKCGVRPSDLLLLVLGFHVLGRIVLGGAVAAVVVFVRLVLLLVFIMISVAVVRKLLRNVSRKIVLVF